MMGGKLGIGDREVIERIRKSDAEMFASLFRAYWQLLVEFAQLYTRDADEAKEIVADFFAGLWERREKLEVRTTVEAYLYWSVRNRAWNIKRNDARRAEIHDEIAELSDYLDVVDNVQMESIDEALAAIPERYREVVSLRWLHEMEFDQIAAILGLSTQNAYKLAQRALQALRKATVQNREAGGS